MTPFSHHLFNLCLSFFYFRTQWNRKISFQHKSTPRGSTPTHFFPPYPPFFSLFFFQVPRPKFRFFAHLTPAHFSSKAPLPPTPCPPPHIRSSPVHATNLVVISGNMISGAELILYSVIHNAKITIHLLMNRFFCSWCIISFCAFMFIVVLIF